MHEQPLALGAIGLAIGAVLGAAAPRTRQEERLMGEASRKLAEKAKGLGSQQLDKAQQAVEQVAEEPTAQPRVQPQPQPQVQSPHPGPAAAGPAKKGAW
ncbi:MAG TPA: YtxH domain-containing protein [Burkholderiales bacterium]|nr:YtxH domain-containing protein [Burkholderiales bacterium]